MDELLPLQTLTEGIHHGESRPGKKTADEDRNPHQHRCRHQPDQETSVRRLGRAGRRGQERPCGSRGPGSFAVPGLLKIERKKIPARPAKKGVPNPFKPGELMDVAAKPATNKVKVRPLKSLKDMV